MPSLWTRFAAAAKAFSLGSAVVDPSWAGWGKSQDDYAPEVYGTYAATSVGVYSCVNLRSTALSALPLKVYRGKGDTRKEQTAGPLVDLLQRVNPHWTLPQLLETTEQSLCLWGQAFWVLERGENGRRPPGEIWFARPDRMKIVPHAENYIAGYVMDVNGRKMPFTPDEVIWFRLPNPMDEFSGLSPIAAARLSIELGRDGLKANHNLFKQGMMGVNVISPADKDTTWNKEKVELLSQLLERRAKGEKKAHSTLVMGHQLNSQPLGVSPADAQFIEQMRWSLADICRVYNVPPVLVQDLEKATYSNFEQALQAFWTLTMVPQANRIATTLTEQLLPMFPGHDEAAFDLSGVSALQEKEDAKWTREAGQIEKGCITINDWRKGRGLKPVAWGDVWWAPATATPVENADQPEPVAPPPPMDDTPPAEMADKALRLLTQIKAWEFDGEQHRTAMKAFDDRATGHEKRWTKMARDLFEQQEAQVLAAIDPANTDKGWGFPEPVVKRRGNSDPFDQKEWEQRFADEAVDQLRVIVKDAGGAVYGELGIGGTFNVSSPATTKFIRQRSQRFAESVNKTTWDRLKNSLADGEKAGETIDQLKERVKVVMRGRIKSDAETIARTEVIGGLNGGALQAAKDSGVVKAKKWLAAIDNRTRDSHIETHGEEVPLDDNFSLGGPAPGQIPDPAESINCRCTMTFVVDEGKALRAFDLTGLKAFVANGHHH